MRGITKINCKMKTKNKYIIYFLIIIIFIFTVIYKLSFEKKVDVYNGADSVEQIFDYKKREMNILIGGDVMLDRYIRKQINKYMTPEEFVKNYLFNLPETNSKYDYVVANLEGPITDYRSKTLLDNGTFGTDLLFTFPTSTPEILKLLNIKIVSLANNHTDNFYHDGYMQTKKYLSESEIKYFGNPYNNNFVDKDENLSEIMCEKEICIAYVAYNQFTSENDKELIGEEIKKLRQDIDIDFIIVMPHWGVEYEKISESFQKEYAHAWVDAGADIVVGAHPHVIQDNEIYKDKNIYYSLGNYIFDQWWKENVKNGLALDITFLKYIDRENNVKREIKINQNLNVYIDRDGVRYK